MFDKALDLILIFEGGFADHPNDPGGATNYGITQAVYDAYRKRSVKKITQDEVKDIYHRNYWIDSRADLFDEYKPNLAVVHFDSAVNCGNHQAALFLQRALGVKDDGLIGKNTLKAIQACDEAKTIRLYLNHRLVFYRHISMTKPALKTFLRGWEIRLKKLAKFVNSDWELPR